MIRQAKLEDLPQLCLLESQCFANEPWNMQQLQSHLQHAAAYIAVLQEQPVAYVLFYQSLDYIEIYRIGVLADYRRNGLASQLLDVTAETTTRIILEVEENNHAALAFYLSQGFVVTSQRKDYYATGTALLLARG